MLTPHVWPAVVLYSFIRMGFWGMVKRFLALHVLGKISMTSQWPYPGTRMALVSWRGLHVSGGAVLTAF